MRDAVGLLIWVHTSSARTSFRTLLPPEQLPDHDCVRGPATGGPDFLPWAEWLEAVQAEGASDLLNAFAPALLVLATEEGRRRAALECPVGALLADVLRALGCYHRAGGGGECYDLFEARARTALVTLGLPVLMGTKWPVFDILASSDAPAAPTEAKEHGMDCAVLDQPVLDWQHFMRVFELDDWYQPAVDVAYGPELEKAWQAAALQCPIGFAVANVVKAMLCAHTESICFHSHATMISAVLEEVPIHLIIGSGWPIFYLLAHLCKVVRRHGFRLDFTPDELLGAEVQLPRAQGSRSFHDLAIELPALTSAVAAAAAGDIDGKSGLVYTTMAHGPRFSPYVGRFIGRARALGIAHALVVFCLDEEAYLECRSSSGHCVRGTPSILNKFTLPLVLLRQGFDVLWLDLDVFLFRSPTPFVMEQQRSGGFELLVSGTFAIDCICSGIVFYHRTPRVLAWLEQLLIWMYNHPYEHDQKAFSAFLRAGERVVRDEDLPVRREETPRWDFLDPETHFVSARHVDGAGWAGDPDEIVAFHLLHGDSDDTVASRQFSARFGLGAGYLPLLDLFFNQSGLPELYSTPVLPHHISPVLREALWRSRWPSPRPRERGRCNETVPMRW